MSLDVSRLAVNSARGVKKQQRLPHCTHVVDSKDLHALHCQRAGRAEGAGRAIGVLVAEQLANKSFPRVADQQREAKLVEPPAIRHQREIVLVRLTKTNAGIKTDSLAFDAGHSQCLDPRLQVTV